MKKVEENLSKISDALVGIKRILEDINNKTKKESKLWRWIKILIPTILTIIGMLGAGYFGAKWTADMAKDKEPLLNYWYAGRMGNNGDEMFIDVYIENNHDYPTGPLRITVNPTLGEMGALGERGELRIEEGISKEDGIINKTIRIHVPSEIDKLESKVDELFLSKGIILHEGDSYQGNLIFSVGLRCLECEGNTRFKTYIGNSIEFTCKKTIKYGMNCTMGDKII